MAGLGSSATLASQLSQATSAFQPLPRGSFLGASGSVIPSSTPQPTSSSTSTSASTAQVPRSAAAIGASSIGYSNDGQIRDLVRQKQEELLEIHEYRVREAEARASTKDAEVEELKRRISKLREDFQYNVRLVEDRDEELRRYETVMDNLKVLIGEKEAQIQDLQTEIAELHARTKQQQNDASVREESTRQRISELTQSLEDANRRHSLELADQRAELEKRVKTLAARVEEDERLRAEDAARLAASYEKSLRERELAMSVAKETQTQADQALRSRLDAALSDVGALRQALVARDEAAHALEKALREAEKQAMLMKRQREEEEREREASVKGLKAEVEELRVAKIKAARIHEEEAGELVSKLQEADRRFKAEAKRHAMEVASWEDKLATAAAQRFGQMEEVRRQLDALRAKHRADVEGLRRDLAAARTETDAAVGRANDSARERLDAAERAREAVAADLVRAKEEAWARESDARVAKARAAGLEQDVSHLKGRLESTNEDLMKTREQIAHLTRAQEEAQRAHAAEVASIHRELERARIEAQSARLAHEAAAAEATTVRATLAKTQTSLQEAQDHALSLTRKAAHDAEERRLEREAEAARAEQLRVDVEAKSRALDAEKCARAEEQADSKAAAEQWDQERADLLDQVKELTSLANGRANEANEAHGRADALAAELNQVKEDAAAAQATFEREIEQLRLSAEDRDRQARQSAIALHVAANAARNTLRRVDGGVGGAGGRGGGGGGGAVSDVDDDLDVDYDLDAPSQDPRALSATTTSSNTGNGDGTNYKGVGGLPPLRLGFVAEVEQFGGGQGVGPAPPFTPAFSEDMGPADVMSLPPSARLTARTQRSARRRPIHGDLTNINTNNGGAVAGAGSGASASAGAGGGGGEDGEYGSLLVEENNRLREMVSHMRREMERLSLASAALTAAAAAAKDQNAQTSPPNHQAESSLDVHAGGSDHAGSASASSEAAALRARVNELEEQLSYAGRRTVPLAASSHSHTVGSVTSSFIAGSGVQAGVLPEQEDEIRRLHHANQVLENRLREESRKLVRVTKERERVMGISNRLRADLARYTEATGTGFGDVSGVGGGVDGASIMVLPYSDSLANALGSISSISMPMPMPMPMDSFSGVTAPAAATTTTVAAAATAAQAPTIAGTAPAVTRGRTSTTTTTASSVASRGASSSRPDTSSVGLGLVGVPAPVVSGGGGGAGSASFSTSTAAGRSAHASDGASSSSASSSTVLRASDRATPSQTAVASALRAQQRRKEEAALDVVAERQRRQAEWAARLQQPQPQSQPQSQSQPGPKPGQ